MNNNRELIYSLKGYSKSMIWDPQYMDSDLAVYFLLNENIYELVSRHWYHIINDNNNGSLHADYRSHGGTNIKYNEKTIMVNPRINYEEKKDYIRNLYNKAYECIQNNIYPSLPDEIHVDFHIIMPIVILHEHTVTYDLPYDPPNISVSPNNFRLKGQSINDWLGIQDVNTKSLWGGNDSEDETIKEESININEDDNSIMSDSEEEYEEEGIDLNI